MKKEGLLYRVKNAATAFFGGTKFTSAVILAGGSGTRVGADKTKQMIELCGKPLVVHTLLAFEACDYIHEIVVVAKKDEIARYEEFRTAYGLHKLTKVVEGGATRQMSAKNGFDAVDERAAYVAIHDGARALVTEDVIRRAVESVEARGSGIASVPVTDTIKRAAPDGLVLDTPDRSALRAMQTPQAFRVELIRKAHEIARWDGFLGTDDAALLEHAGMPVYLCEGSREISSSPPRPTSCSRS